MGRLSLPAAAGLLGLGFTLFFFPPVNPGARANEPVPGKYWIFIGTYSGGPSKGIYRSQFDAATGKFGPVEIAAEAHNPSFLAVHPTLPLLVAVGEHSDVGRMHTGAVGIYSLDRKNGALNLLNEQSSGGAGPCFVTIDQAGKNALVANYTGGSVAVLPIGKDGHLGMASSVIHHEGGSVDRQRQGEPHAHSINLDRANHFAFAADLGCDKLFVYRFDPARGTLTPAEPPAVTLPAGSGPRHFAFHPSGKFAYLINEMALTLTVLAYDAEHGSMKSIQTISTLPPGDKGEGYSTAEVVVHPSGKFVYGSNRGHNSISVFAVNETSGKLQLVQNMKEGIQTPRNFNLDPSGRYLLVANQDGNSVIAFQVDPATGKLTPTGASIQVPKPVCIKFVPMSD
jgi:6-phosphogluconolactonase